MFGGQEATGKYAVTVGGGLASRESEFDEEYSIDPESCDVHSDPTPPSRVRTSSSRTNLPANRRRGKKSANEIRQDLINILNRLISVVENPTPSSTQSSTPASTIRSVQDVCHRLEEIPETSSGGPLLMFALKLFEKKENREYFLAIKRQDWQLLWLQMKYDEEYGGGSSSTRN